MQVASAKVQQYSKCTVTAVSMHTKQFTHVLVSRSTQTTLSMHVHKQVVAQPLGMLHHSSLLINPLKNLNNYAYVYNSQSNDSLALVQPCVIKCVCSRQVPTALSLVHLSYMLIDMRAVS